MFVMLFLVAIAAAAIFGYLFFTGQNALNQAKQDKLNGDVQIAGLQQTVTDLSKPRTFTDTVLGMNATYPFDWVPTMNTNITDKFATEGAVSGPILGGYGWTFIKGDATLTMNKILGGVGGRGLFVDPATYDMQILTSSKGDIVRYSLKGKNEWAYVTKADCKDFDEAAGKADAVCTGILFSKNDTANLPTEVELKGTSDAALIAEADQIVMSTQK